MTKPIPLGTQLRHLIDLLDGDVERAYATAGLAYRPRYTPIVRALRDIAPASIRAIADRAGMTHSAVSQTVAQMRRAGLVAQTAGRDGRERVVTATLALTGMLPALERLWTAADRAAAALDAELPMPLTQILAAATKALERRSFAERLADASASS